MRTVKKKSKSKPAGNVEKLLQRIRGLIVALATPLDRKGSLDTRGLEKLIDRVEAGGASCLFPLGWMGEQPLLTQKTRENMMRATCEIARGRLPVMVGVSEHSLPRALELSNMAEQAGADLLLATPPFSYEIPQELIVDYFTGLASASRVPLVIYQNDETGVRLETENIVRLSKVPGLIGVKAYVPYLVLKKYFYRAHREGKFAVISGDEYIYEAALLAGIRHFTMGGPGNLCPGWCSGIYHSALEGDWAGVMKKQKRLTDFCDAIYPQGETAYAVIKYILERMGICSAYITSPHRTITREKGKKIDRALEKFEDVLAG